jgi:hypothetical protein
MRTPVALLLSVTVIAPLLVTVFGLLIVTAVAAGVSGV